MNKQQEKEWAILIALFKATVEQQSMLTGTQRQRSKIIFKRWNNLGGKMLDIMEGKSDEALLDELAERIEDAVDVLRKEIIV